MQDMCRKGRANFYQFPYYQGEQCGNHKLTEKEVVEIRKKYIPREYTLHKLAKEYNIDFTTVHNIVKRQTWRHIKDYDEEL